MSIHTVEAHQVPPQAWRNGGGQTRELLAWPDAEHWQVRISRAEIASDGPFSEFAGVQRWFAVLEGAGVVLQFADSQKTLLCGDEPLAFDGASAPLCALIDGPTQDLNLMVRGGHGAMQVAHRGTPWSGNFTLRALYAATPGVWSDCAQTLPLTAHTLLWSTRADLRPWTFEAHPAHSTGRAWWLGFTPKTAP